MNNIDYTNKYKNFLIGFLISFIPYCLVLLLFSIINKGFNNIPTLFRDTICYACIITSIINGYFIQKKLANNS